MWHGAQQHITSSSEAAQADTEQQAEDEVENLQPEEVVARLEQIDAVVRPPGGFSTWTEAVADAWMSGFDSVREDLLSDSYQEQFAHLR